MIVGLGFRRIVAIEVKAAAVDLSHVWHLVWLGDQLGDSFAAASCCTPAAPVGARRLDQRGANCHHLELSSTNGWTSVA